MIYDVIVVGAGLSGLFAGALAARRGLSTLVIAQGVGATHVGTGCIDVLGYDARGQRLASPMDALPVLLKANPRHPYALAGLDALRGGLAELQAVCEAAGYPLSGELSANYWLPTAAGATRPACLAPDSFVAGEVRRPEPVGLASLPGFRDYDAAYAAGNLRQDHPALPVEVSELSLPDAPTHREAYATDVARLLDNANYRAKAAKAWKSQLDGAKRAGFPAVLGLDYPQAVRRDLSERLEAEIFEIPILPPSVPGMRLHRALETTLREASGELVLGPQVTGAVGGRDKTPRVHGVAANATGRWTRYVAGAVILATGGFLGGGLVSPRSGVVAESVFDLPVAAAAPRQSWFDERLFGPHAFARFGLRVDESMRALDAAGEVMYENLYAVGAVLAGADRLAEGSREGISVATAFKAVNALAGSR